MNVDAVERARILRGWNLVELSRIAQVDRGTLSDLIHGVRQPTLGTVQAVIVALGLTLADVIEFDDMQNGSEAPSATRCRELH